MHDEAREILVRARQAGCEVVLPRDVVIANQLIADIASDTTAVEAVPSRAMILDLGAATVDGLVGRVPGWRTVVWNGPLGAFEVPPFDKATTALARAVADATQAGHLTSVAGGGDTIAALHHAGVADRFTYVSAAGGAFLEWLEGRTLPGVAALGS